MLLGESYASFTYVLKNELLALVMIHADAERRIRCSFESIYLMTSARIAEDVGSSPAKVICFSIDAYMFSFFLSFPSYGSHMMLT